jgi:hypothetical protein
MDVIYQNGIPTFGKFQVVPAYNSSTGNGRQIQGLWPHEKSGYVFIEQFNGNNPYQLKKVSLHSSAPENVSDNFLTALIKGDFLFFLTVGEFHFGQLDINANFTEGNGSPVSITEFSNPWEKPTLHLNPADSIIYIFQAGNSPKLYKFSDPYNSMSSITTYSNVMPAGLDTNVEWKGFGIAPDGRYFIHGSGMNGYSVNGISWVTYSSVYNQDLDYVFAGNISNYYAYNSSGYNTNKGDSASWHSNGEPGGMPTSASGPGWPICVDPNNYEVIYYRTEVGVGVSIDRGSSIIPNNEGLEAVEVYSIDMVKDQGIGWVASSAGLRKVSNFTVSPVWGDPVQIPGRPMSFRSVCFDKNNYNTIYAGLDNLYKSVDGGNTWNYLFSADKSPYNYNPLTSHICSIAICDSNPSIVAIGYNSLSNAECGLFASTDAGQNWEQILLKSASIGSDFSINKVLFNYEHGDTVLYACNFDGVSDSSTIFRVVKHNVDWEPAFDMSTDRTVSGLKIAAGIKDICKNSDGSLLYAVGFDISQQYYGPAVYYKDIASGKWDRITKTGLPSNKEPRAITFGNNKIYCAFESDVYFKKLTDTSWTLLYSYSRDNDIYFLYFDDLLVGAATGLYEHFENPLGTVSNNLKPALFKLEQNYPNPFNPVTVINYSIPKAGLVTIKVYDVLGREVKTLVNENKPAGNYNIEFNAAKFASGVYFYRMHSGDFSETKKFVLLK